MLSVISNMLKSIISTTVALKNALAIAILRLLPKSATPLIMSLTIKPFGFVLLVLLLPILWKFWPDASSVQLEIDPSVEPNVGLIPDVGTSGQPDSELEPTPDESAPVTPQQNQGWSRAAKWGLTIVGAGAILIGIVTLWYYWPIEPTVDTVRQIINQTTTANYNELRDALVDNDQLHTYIDILNERDVCFRSTRLYTSHWEWGNHIERKLWNLIGNHAKYPITKGQMAALLEHFNYSVVSESAIDFVERMNHHDSIRAIPGPKGISLDEIANATSTTAKWQLVGYLLLVGGVMVVVTVLTR